MRRWHGTFALACVIVAHETFIFLYDEDCVLKAQPPSDLDSDVPFSPEAPRGRASYINWLQLSASPDRRDLTMAGMGLSNADSNINITASGSRCPVQEKSRHSLTCMTSPSKLSDPQPPFWSCQGVHRRFWATDSLIVQPNLALTVPDGEAEHMQVLPTYSLPFDGQARPFVEMLSSVLRLPASFPGQLGFLRNSDISAWDL